MPTSIIFIVAFLALFIAIVALWLVCEVTTKVEMKLSGFVQTHITPIYEEISSTNQALSKVVEDVEKLSKSVTTIDNMASRIAKVAENLDKLDRSIPQRYRDGMVQPKEASKRDGMVQPKEASKKVTTKLKK